MAIGPETATLGPDIAESGLEETKESFDTEEREEVLRGFLSPELFRRGLICRADDRGEPVIQLPPRSSPTRRSSS